MKILPEISRTLSEYLLIPGLTTEDCTPDNVDLGAPLVRHRVGEEPSIRIATPMVSAIMQAVSSPTLAVALAQAGGLSFIHQNQLIEDQAADVLAVKRHEAGVRTGATHHRATVDGEKRLRVGAGINSRDFKDRIPALTEAGADVLCLDSSDGYSVHQARTLEFAREAYGDDVLVGAGNVVDGRAFRYLADAGAAFVKVGIGGGAICTTRAQKGIGRGQASALIDVVQARDAYAQETGVYVPLCCDGGLLNDSHMAMALAMGSDFIMLGRYFARLDESPSRKLQIGDQWYKEYWGEGSRRAQNAARYGQRGRMVFEEGVDGYVPYAGSLYDNVERTRAKLTSTMISCGSTSLRDFHRDALLVPVSAESFKQTGAEVQLRHPAIDAAE
ncbi:MULTISPECIES: IMP dehydrogenase [unclassified Streptomyces]|uniref:IMP dehydrogenase n=1 Tax=unclassified Streptomyces TaxID=2593676 RepID=UPI00202F1C87|nr:MULTISPECIES: IMP dehydrogenase [unclassified Streptomyces]MCM1965260.1 IMP dehydrogenase [Streptomyces sp. G1]MCX5300957.1 IMP dehydrogenase [Streptomyces sp. NBC_00193]